MSSDVCILRTSLQPTSKPVGAGESSASLAFVVAHSLALEFGGHLANNSDRKPLERGSPGVHVTDSGHCGDEGRRFGRRWSGICRRVCKRQQECLCGDNSLSLRQQERLRGVGCKGGRFELREQPQRNSQSTIPLTASQLLSMTTNGVQSTRKKTGRM